jgi:DNA (cytosine-5)-methyltransferase 1
MPRLATPKTKRKMQTGTYRLIDLFSGAGGLSLGFSKKFGHRFESVWANDFDEDCVLSYNENFGEHCVHGDIVQLLNDRNIRIPKADIVIGGPPCQGFSLLNKKRGDDPRRELWRQYFEVVERSGADIFVMENVPQILDSFEHGEIIGAAKTLGFEFVTSGKLLAADYGVPQIRSRAFIIGCKFADPATVFPPQKTNYNPKNGYLPGVAGYVRNPDKWVTVKQVIGRLPAPQGTEIRNAKPPLDLHFGRNPTPMSLKRYKAIPREGMNRFDLQRRAPAITPGCWIRKKSGGTDLFGRLWWDRPAFTIRTEFFKPEKGRYLHPEQNRPITHREAARFQTFPDDFIFYGSKIEIAKQIGNAVPPLLASAVAGCIEKLLESRK